MREKTFEYSPFFRGLYIAMLWFIPFLVWVAPQWVWPYVGLMIFLGLCLRPLLEWTGLVVWWQDRITRIDERLHRKSLNRHRMLVERRERDKKYRYSNRKDPRLPKNW